MTGLNFNSPWVIKTDVDWSKLKAIGQPKTYSKNAIIYTQNTLNPVYYIAKGRVRISVVNKHGIEKTLGVVFENNIFGEFPSIDCQSNFSTATSIVDSLLYVIQPAKFMAALADDAELNYKVLQNLTRKIRILSSQVQDLTFLSSYERIVRALYNLTIDQGISRNEGWEIPVKFTHQEMADLVGTCRVTVSKVFSNLNETQIIDRRNGYYLILDPEALKELGGG